MRYVTGLVILIAASMACSRGNDRAVAQSPTGPTAVAETTIAYVGGVSGPMDVLFPGRNESFLFRNDLETKYATGLGRAAGRHLRRQRRRSGVAAGIHPLPRQWLRSRHRDVPRDHADRRRRRGRHLCGAPRWRESITRRATTCSTRAARSRPSTSRWAAASVPHRSIRKAPRSGSRSTCAIAPAGAVTPRPKPRSSRRSTAARCRPPATSRAATFSVPTSSIPAPTRARSNSKYAR